MGVKQTINTAKNTSPASIFVEERRQRALELRKKKLSLDAIARELGTSRATAYRDVMAAKKEIVSAELAKAALAEDMQTYGKLLATFLPLAEKGDDRAARIVLDTTEQRAKQLGTIAQPGKLNPYIPAAPMGDSAEQLGIEIRIPDWTPPPADISPAKPATEAQRAPSLPSPEYRFEPPIVRPAKPANGPTGPSPQSPPPAPPQQGWKQGDRIYYPAADDDVRRH
jgi:hypothetical protein